MKKKNFKCKKNHIYYFSDFNDFGNITTRGLYLTFGKTKSLQPIRNNSKRNHNRHAVTQLKDHIKFVLNIDDTNDSADDYILQTFNIFNPDPIYIFSLPDKFNHTLVLRRSNFSEISFPNMTALQTLQKILKTSKFRQFLENDNNRKPKQDRQFLAKYQRFISDESDLHEAENLKIIEENIRTERNFFKFMDKLNEDDNDDSVVIEADHRNHHIKKKPISQDYQSLIKNIHSKDNIGNYDLTTDDDALKHLRPTKRTITWEDFGLHGWTGHINMQHGNPEENG